MGRQRRECTEKKRNAINDVVPSGPLIRPWATFSPLGRRESQPGGSDMTLFEVDEAASHIRDEVQDDANIVGGGKFRVSVVATDLEGSPLPASASNAAAEQVQTRTLQ